jgi:hypothetical protein
VHTVESAGVWFLVRSVIQNSILRIWCLSNGKKLQCVGQNYTILLSWKLILMETKWHIHIFTYLQKHTFTFLSFLPSFDLYDVQDGREVTVHPDNTHLRLNISLHCTGQHAVQCKMVGWKQCAR